ncbi:fructokinase [Actinoplanes sp. SE50]|uniref:carbohydrate kinase family protein n=1 Tax=unclassified Actinoplanes TaxID=2626549 RepID=UPI00023EC987|nr:MULTISPECIES: carbohydrate kinase [unclassified Actinoplanes]AEV84761.1 fructokinase [Actinoplanes sp. SE50/110]ATO83153.1 fructokinase [Actinoplanes sp. SE50]SLM00560.1 fructokinase [Actinoplanes sp. SE50/110]
MRRFLVVGESILDVISDEQRELPGGSPANVAVGLGRLGNDVGLWTHLGADPAGDLLRAHLTGSGVDLLAPIAGVTSRALAAIQPDGSARYDFAVEWPRWPGGPAPAETARHLHTGSIAALMAPGGGDVERLLVDRRDAMTVSYDPNIRPALIGDPDDCRTRVESIVAGSDVVKASDEDLAWLYPGMPALNAARHLLALGPALVCVTLGAQGALAIAGEVQVTVPPVAVSVVDTVGAGDAFMSGLLDGLGERGLLGAAARPRLHAITGEDLRAVLSHAALVAGLTVARAGATPPTRAELMVRNERASAT